MVKNTFENATVYEAPGHHGVVLRRFHGKEETGAQKFWVGMSHFEPHGGAGWGYADNACEKCYYILEGQMTTKDRNGNEWKLNAGDSFSMVERRALFRERDRLSGKSISYHYISGSLISV
ncbi:MAG: cupin [Eubacterium sp.]